MMNWSVIILGLVALSSVAIAENSYLVIVPKLLKVGYDNQFSVFIAAASQPVQVKFELTVGQQYLQGSTTVNPGATRNATLTLPNEFPVGAGELTITGTGGVSFEEKRDIIVYDNSYVVLVQTSASTYHPGDTMQVRVVVLNEELIPVENDEVLIEIYDANLKLVGEFHNVSLHSGLTETLEFPIGSHCNIGSWLVSAIVDNTTSSVQVLVAEPVTPSFDLKAIFQRFLLRTDKTLRGIIEIDCDNNEPIFGRAIIAVNQVTEQDVQNMIQQQKQQQQQQQQSQQQSQQQQQQVSEQWRSWKSQQIEIAGRVEINYDLLSLFNVDVTKALAVQVYIQVTDLASGQERFVQHVIPIFTRDIIYDIRPLQFEAGITNEFEVVAKRPDGKPAKMENLIVTITMLVGNQQGKVQEEKQVEVREFYTRGRTDIGLFNVEIPENVIGCLMTITPLSQNGQVRGYRTHAIPLSPTPRRHANTAKLSIELLPSTTSQVQPDPNIPVSSQISTVGRTSNFYVQVMPSGPVQKLEPLPMSYVLLTNGRITLTGEFTIQPTKECQSKVQRSIQPEQQAPPACVFNGTLPIQITHAMIPYSTLLVYTFQPSFGFNVAESYRFAVAGLFQSPLTLNATIVPFTSTNTNAQQLLDEVDQDGSSSEDVDLQSVTISSRAQDKTRVQLSFTGTPGSTVGLNVIEYDAVIQGLTNEITTERLLQYLTTYEQVPIYGMPTQNSTQGSQVPFHTRGLTGEGDYQDLTTPWDIDSTTPYDGQEGSSGSSDSQKRGVIGRTSTVPNIPTGFGSKYPPTPSNSFQARAVVSEEEEQQSILREHLALKIRYPVEKMAFGLCASRSSTPVEGDDPYTTPNLGRLYGDKQTQQSQSSYRRRVFKAANQYDVSVGENEFVIATSMPVTLKAAMVPPNPQAQQGQQQQQQWQQQQQGQDYVDATQQGESQEPRDQYPQYGTPAWYERMNSKLNTISQEAFQFMHSGLSVVTDFSSLYVPVDARRQNLTNLFRRYRQQSFIDLQSFTLRDEARQLLEEYLVESDLSMVPPPIVLEEQARTGYYRSVFFNTSSIESQGTGKIVLPRTKPYSTWLATGFSLNPKSGLSVAQPIRLPTNQGLFILGSFPSECQIGEHVLLTYGINNYLGKDLSNIVIRIRASADFDLIEQAQPERVASSNGKDYTITIPSLRTLGVETRNIVLVPKRAGVVKIILEVESEFGGDYEILTTNVLESGIQRLQYSSNLFDLTSGKKSYGPIVEKITQSPFLRSVRLSVSGTGLDRLVEHHTFETNSLVGVDRAIIRLWRLLGLGCYLNETSQTETLLYNATIGNITTAYQNLLLYGDYNGSFSFISDQGEQLSSLYLTTFALGALMSPIMPVHDNVTLNRTLSWILAQQQPDGSFDDQGPCFHYRFCSGEYRRQSLTALVLYSLTHNNLTNYMPQFIYSQLFEGQQSPILRAQRYLESQLETVKPCLLTTTLLQLALVQCPLVSEQLKQRIMQNVRSNQLTVVPENGAKFWKIVNDNKYTVDDQILVNSFLISICGTFGDYQTTSEIARWIVEQLETHPSFDTVLDAVFVTEAWIKVECLFHQQFGSEKCSIVVDVTADNGQKQQFQINSANMDITQHLRFTLPVNQITYTVSGFGIAGVCLRQVYCEKQQQQTNQQIPFQLTNEYQPMPWLSEIMTKTCLTYTPTARDQQLVKGTFNRTIVVQVQLPSGTRINFRQVGFFLSRVPEAMYFTFNERCNTINFFINVPSTVFGKQICLEWCFERLSFVSQWAPIQIRAYDYLQPEIQLTRLVPVQFQPAVLGYSFVEAVHKARPTMEQLQRMQQQQQPPPPQSSRV